MTTHLTQAEARRIGVEGYTYLYPLVLMELTRRQLTNGIDADKPGHGPAGSFTHIRAFPTADFKEVVRPNFDTLYSTAWLDVAAEPAHGAGRGGRHASARADELLRLDRARSRRDAVDAVEPVPGDDAAGEQARHVREALRIARHFGG